MTQTKGPMAGKTCVVTGASSGIGQVTARELAKMGAKVVMVVRDKARGEAAAERIRAAGGQDVSLMLADLSSQAEIRKVAGTLRRELPRIDVLVNNAGGVNGSRQLTADGLERTFAVNHLAYFLLTNLLREKLVASAPARIVNVASEAQRGGRIKFDDLMGEKKYSGMGAYTQSKLANVIFTYELARRWKGTGVTVNALDPGPVATNFGMKGGGLMGVIAKIARPFELTPEKGADTVIWLASSPEAEGRTGEYFNKRKPIRSRKESYDLELAKRLWEVSEQLTGLRSADVAA
jgi:NAD(P)-dependent dehydrogenase (short-subunit alcohol dehydrogenase family)